jgi:hypothetical protein
MFKKAVAEFLKDVDGKAIHINIIGAIRIPYFIEILECELDDFYFSLGEKDAESYAFTIYWESIKDCSIRDGLVKLKLEFDGLITYLEIIGAE